MMPNGLYTLWFFFLHSFFLLSFLMPNLCSHWTDLNQIWTHIHLWLLFEKFGLNSPGIYPHGLGAKNAFLGLTLNFDWTYLCSGTWYQFVNLQGLPYVPPNLVNFSTEIAQNGQWDFTYPRICTLGDTASLTTCTLYSSQQANFGAYYVVART